MLLYYIAFGIPNCSKSKIVLEESLESLTSLIDSFNESTGSDLLYIGTKTLAVACQEYPDISSDQVIYCPILIMSFTKPYIIITFIYLIISETLAVRVGSPSSHEAS